MCNHSWFASCSLGPMNGGRVVCLFVLGRRGCSGQVCFFFILRNAFWCRGNSSVVERWIPVPAVGGSIPSSLTLFRVCPLLISL